MVEVNYRGGGMDGVTSNAASEATLLRLLSAIEKGGGGSGGGAGAQKMYNKAVADGFKTKTKDTDATKDGTKAQEQNTSAVQRASNAVKNFAKSVDRYTFGALSGIMNTGKAAGDLAIELVAGGNRISDFSKHVTGLVSKFPIFGGLVGGLAQTFINAIDSQVDTFRELSNVGMDFGGDLFEIQRKAIDAGLSLETFAGALAQNGDKLAIAFGGATNGADRFQRITKDIQKNQNVFSALGMTMEDVTEFTADYLDMQRIQGRIGQMNDRQLAKGTQDYIMQLDQLSKITGMSRKQAAEELKAQTQDKRLKNIFAAMDEGTKKNVQGVLAMVGNASPEMKEAITEMIATGGTPVSDFAKSLVRTNPELAELARGLKNGTVSQDEFTDGLRRAQEKAVALSQEQGNAIGALSALGSTAFDGNTALMSMGFAGGKVSDALEAQNKAIESGRGGLLNFESAITKFRNVIIGTIINSGVFKDLIGQFEALTMWISSPQGTEKLKTAIQPIAEFLEGLFKDIKTLKFKEVIEKYVTGPLKRMFMGESKEDKVARLQKEQGLSKSDAEAKVADEGSSGGILSALLPKGISFKALAIGIGVVAAGVIALGLAGKVASPGLLLIAAAFAGIGVAGMGLADLVNAITEGVGKMADGMKKFEELDAGKLENVGNALDPLTKNLMGLAKGGLVASFIGDGAFEKLSAGLKSFESIDPTKMMQLGPALESMHKGISAFTGDGLLDSFSKFLGGLFGNDGNLGDLQKELKNFADIDAVALEKVGTAMQGMANFMATMDKADIGDVSDNLRDLTKELANYQSAYSKLDADTKASIEKMINVSVDNQKQNSDGATSLNSIMQEVLAELKKQTRGQRNIEANFAGGT